MTSAETVAPLDLATCSPATPEEALGRLGAATSRGRFAYATSWPTEQVVLDRPGGGRISVLVKRLTGTVRKPASLVNPHREPAVYRALDGTSLGIPRCYALGSNWVVIEHVPGIPLWQSGDLGDWLRTAQWASRLHARFAGQLPPADCLLCHDRAYYDAIVARAAPPPDLATAAADATERLLALPRTLVHGELYPSNVVVAGERIAVVDWEMAAVGPGAVDLAALVTGFDAQQAEAIVAAYGGCRATDLSAARLLLALQWVGWSPGWEPPAEHRRDWVAEARAAAEMLG